MKLRRNSNSINSSKANILKNMFNLRDTYKLTMRGKDTSELMRKYRVIGNDFNIGKKNYL